METSTPTTSIFRFGPFELDVREQELRRAGLRLPLRPQVFMVLLLLLERRGQLVRREQLIERLWGQREVFVDFDVALNAAIRRLRELLGDTASLPRFVETLPKKGYRFIAPVEALPPRAAAAEVRPARLPPRVLARQATLALLALVAAALVVSRSLAPESPPPGSSDERARAEYAQALYLLEKEEPRSLAASERHFEAAIERDPTFARAHEGLAQARLRRAFLSGGGDAPWNAIRGAAATARSLDARLAGARTALGLIYLFHDWDFGRARAELAAAVDLAPHDAEAVGAYAAYLAATGELEGAVSRARRARDLDPRRMSVRADLCWFLLHASRLEEALDECQRALALEPRITSAALGEAEALRLLGSDGAAVRRLADVFALSLPAPGSAGGDLRELWRQIAARADGAAAAAPRHYFLAVAHALAGERERALERLGRAVEAREPAVLLLRSDPGLSSLRADHRFEQLVRRIAFPARRTISPTP